MGLAGQERRTRPAFGIRHSAFDQRGYAMAALLTMLAVMAILLSAVLPVWRHEMRREKEAELVFRGEQYVHAIGLFQRKFATFPPNVDVLVQQKFLRKKYLDPVTGKDFRPVYVGQLQQQQQGSASLTQPSQLAVRPGQSQPAGVGGLMGVASTSEEDSIRIYKGRTKYNQWQFLYAGATTRPGMPGGPGQRGPGEPGMQRPGFPGPGGGRGRGEGPFGRPRGPGGPDRRPQGPGGPFGPVRPPGGN